MSELFSIRNTHKDLVRAMNPHELSKYSNEEFDYWPQWAQRDVELIAQFEQTLLNPPEKTPRKKRRGAARKFSISLTGKSTMGGWFNAS